MLGHDDRSGDHDDGQIEDNSGLEAGAGITPVQGERDTGVIESIALPASVEVEAYVEGDTSGQLAIGSGIDQSRVYIETAYHVTVYDNMAEPHMELLRLRRDVETLRAQMTQSSVQLTCTDCSTVIRLEWTFCPYCRCQLVRHCVECGEKIIAASIAAKYCPFCGAVLDK